VAGLETANIADRNIHFGYNSDGAELKEFFHPFLEIFFLQDKLE
jgi:hypothetical protein